MSYRCDTRSHEDNHESTAHLKFRLEYIAGKWCASLVEFSDANQGSWQSLLEAIVD